MENIHEKRLSARIKASRLPKALQTLKLTFEDGKKLTVKTLDASETGISFKIDIPVHAITEFNVMLEPMDSSFKISDELVYIKSMDSGTSRVSIRFSKTNDLTNYRKLLKQSS